MHDNKLITWSGPSRERRDLGRLVRAERERLGLTRAQLCGLADCSLGYLASIEHGAGPKESPIVTRIQAVLAAIGEDAMAVADDRAV